MQLVNKFSPDLCKPAGCTKSSFLCQHSLIPFTFKRCASLLKDGLKGGAAKARAPLSSAVYREVFCHKNTEENVLLGTGAIFQPCPPTHSPTPSPFQNCEFWALPRSFPKFWILPCPSLTKSYLVY